MQTLSATLSAAQKSASGVPHVQVRTRAESANVRTLSWSRYYTGAEAAQPCACAVAADGALVRARATGGRVYVSRVAAPGSGSDYSVWTDLAPCHASSPVALSAGGGVVALWHADAAGTGLMLSLSGDGGATWTAPALVDTAAGTIAQLAAAYGSGGSLVVFLAVGATVYRKRYDGAAWGPIMAWTNAAGSITGLAVFHQGDYNLVITGTDTPAGDAYVWSAIFGDNYGYPIGTWGPLEAVMAASAGSGVAFQEPAAGQPDVYRLWYLETFTGTTGYNRPYWSHGTRGAVDFADNVWREPVPFDLDTARGLSMCASGTGVWLVVASGVWYAPLDGTVNDLTADVVGVDLQEDGAHQVARVVLANGDGRYNAGGAGADYLVAGYQLEVALGLTTSAGDETAAARHYWIRSWDRQRDRGRAVVEVEAVGPLGLLERWRARRQVAWAAGTKTRYQLLAWILGRVGLELTAPGSTSAALTTEKPAFVVQAGESGAAAVRRLLDQVPEVLYWRKATGYLKQTASSDGSVYDYGTDHVILRSSSTVAANAVNRVQVFGAGVFDEAFDWTEIGGVGDHLDQVVDDNLDTAAKAAGRAAAASRKWALGSTPATLVVPVNCGVELYDVVTVTDAGVDLSGVVRRVRGYRVRYVRERRPTWELELALGGA